jgi:hypothetical protein
MPATIIRKRLVLFYFQTLRIKLNLSACIAQIFKVETFSKKTDYAERVKMRNKILLAEQEKREKCLEEGASQSPRVQPSKTQRVYNY